jgi:fructose-1-phosphate kinase PfkB-like protein
MGHSSPARAGKTPAVVTFTANPSIDRTIVLGQALERGEVQRARGVFEQAAGKGVNVAQVLFNAGIDVAVVTAAIDAPYRALSDRAQTPLAVVGVPLSGAQRVRVNTTITEPDGTTTKINEAGPELTPAQVALAAEALTDVARGAAWVALSGSLPPGAPDDWYATLGHRAAPRRHQRWRSTPPGRPGCRPGGPAERGIRPDQTQLRGVRPAHGRGRRRLRASRRGR